MANCVENIRTKNNENLIILFKLKSKMPGMFFSLQRVKGNSFVANVQQNWKQTKPNTPTFTETFPRGNSQTQITKVGDIICVADFYDLCPRCRGLCRGLCRKVSVMEFGFYALLSHMCAEIQNLNCVVDNHDNASGNTAQQFHGDSRSHLQRELNYAVIRRPLVGCIAKRSFHRSLLIPQLTR